MLAGVPEERHRALDLRPAEFEEAWSSSTGSAPMAHLAQPPSTSGPGSTPTRPRWASRSVRSVERTTPRLRNRAPRNRPPVGAPTASGPVDVADVWINGDFGFVLLLHRRHDGLPAEELYYPLRFEGGTWARPDHLGGGMIGLEVSDRSAVAEALAGAPMAVVAESESLVHTGRGRSGDGALDLHNPGE